MHPNFYVPLGCIFERREKAIILSNASWFEGFDIRSIGVFLKAFDLEDNGWIVDPDPGI